MSNSSLKVVFLEKLMCEMKDRQGNKIQTFLQEISIEVVGFNGGLLVSASTYENADSSSIPCPSSHLILHDFLYTKWVNLF